MTTSRVLLLFPGSLFGGRWADGPRVKPEMVSLHTELRRAGHDVDVLDLEAEYGNPLDDAARQRHLAGAERLLAAREAPDLVVVSAWSALQYSAAVAVAERARRAWPGAVLAVHGAHVATRAGDFAYEGSPFNWLVVGEAELALVELAGAVAAGDRDTASCRPLEGVPLPLDAEHLPDLAAYPYATEGLDSIGVFLSRGCPYNAPACLLRPGGAGWHAYPPDAALRLLDEAAALAPRRIDVLDPAFGYEPAWRRAVFDAVAASDRRDLALSVSAKADTLQRTDLDRAYKARVRLLLDVGTLSTALLSRTGNAARPRDAAAHAVDLLTYASAKGLLTQAGLTFNQPGETRETAAETLAALEAFVAAAPNTSVALQAEPWAFLPAGEAAADVEAPRSRFGTTIMHPEWWREPLDSHVAATAVRASAGLDDLPPGDQSYWRPRFDELAAALAEKLTADARRGLRSHESVGSEAYGVPHGWWVEPRWH